MKMFHSAVDQNTYNHFYAISEWNSDIMARVIQGERLNSIHETEWYKEAKSEGHDITSIYIRGVHHESKMMIEVYANE